jgi:hypothetical protein
MARRKRKSRRSGSRVRANFLGAALGLIAVLGFGTLAYFKFTLAPETLDPVTLCPVSGPEAQMAILLDMTDPVSASQLAAARSMIEREIDRAALGTRISLGLVSPDPAVQGKVHLSVCKPRTGADANELYENPIMIAARYRDGFAAPLEAVLESLLAADGSKTSPIMESLQALIADAPGFRVFEGTRKLVIFSDLMQHGDLISFYRGQTWRDLEKSGAIERFAHSLTGADVVILRIPRPKAPAADVDDFWSRYFDLQGAASVRLHVVGDL